MGGLGNPSTVGVSASAVTGDVLFCHHHRRGGGVLPLPHTPSRALVSVRLFEKLGGVVLHTGSLHAMAVWGTPLGVCTQGGYAWSPTPVCS